MINPIILKYYMEQVQGRLSEEMLKSVIEKHGEAYLVSLIEKAAKRRVNAKLAWSDDWDDRAIFKKAS